MTYESQPYSSVYERAGAGGLLQAAVDLAWTGGFVRDGSGGSGGFIIGHDDHDAPIGSSQPVHNATAGKQWFNHAASSG